MLCAACGYATIKQTHHDVDLDQPGKDSLAPSCCRSQRGAADFFCSLGLLHELRDEAEPTLAAACARLSPCDLVLVEGFKQEAIPKLEIHRPANAKPLLYPQDRHIIAIASDVAIEAPLPFLISTIRPPLQILFCVIWTEP